MPSLPDFSRDDFLADLSAGLTVGVMLVPQAMAYAMLAGLPPIVGLYASVAPLLAYAALGTSRQLAVGPVAMVSLLTATSVGAIAQSGTESYLAAAVMLAALVGVLQVAMGALRLGALVSFLSHPVLSGFTSAAALIIGLNQVKHVLGVPLPRTHHVHELAAAAARALPEAHGPTLVLGLAAAAVLLVIKRSPRKIPGPLVAVVGATAAVFFIDLGAAGVALVGAVPAGLPRPSIPALDLGLIKQLLPMAATIAFVGFLESISVAKVFAHKHRYRLRADRELVALGAANLASALFGGYSVTGGFSRSAVNDQAGARTRFAAVVSAAVVAGALLFLTPLFAWMPKAVLASIILVAVAGLVDVAEVRHLWRTDRVDLGLLLTTFVATLALGIEQGILAGVAASMFVFVARRTQPHIAVLGRLPGTTVFRNVDHHPAALTTPGVLALRIDSALYFGNVEFVDRTLRRLESEMTTPLHAVVLDATGINGLDSSAAHALTELSRRYAERDVRLLIAGAKAPVRTVLHKTGLAQELGPEALPLTVDAALNSTALAA